MQPLGDIKTQRIGKLINAKIEKPIEPSTTKSEDKTETMVKEAKTTPKPRRARSSVKTPKKTVQETEES
jgi:hypothetical protein